MIWFLLLIELVLEVRYGDKHDVESGLRLLLIIAIASLWGLLQESCYYAGYYLLLRFAIFDISFAVLRGNEWHYLGETSNWDKLIKNFNKWLLLATRVVALITIFYVEFKK